MTRTLALAATAATLLATPALAQTSAGVPTAVEITPFAFETTFSRNPDFNRTAYTYPSGDLAGQVNENTGDVRLDGVTVDGTAYAPDRLQFVSEARIVLDDAVDAVRGGHNLTTGYGIGADLDPWTGEGRGSTTPSVDDLVAAHANFNLSSIGPVREGAGTAVFEYSFAEPTTSLFIWERGGSGDVLVSALDADGNVLGSFKVRDGAGDGTLPANYAPTGIVVTTYVQDGFLNQGQELGSVGLRFSEPVSSFRFTVYQEAEGEGAVRYNGPDLKILALRG
jgi:hypothetical protein